MKSIVLLTAAIGVAQACQREFTFRGHHRQHVKRQSTGPPVLDANEQLLVDSFDNASISTWSYYYSSSNP